LPEFSLWLHPVSIDLSLEQGMFEERLPLASEKKIRYLIALHWTKGLLNQIKRYVYSAVDVEKN